MSLEDYDDLDFDDPRFLQLAASAAPPAELSYAQKRKRALIRSEDKGRSKSRKQEEEDKRAQGLGTNLIQRAEEEGGESKALQMMKCVPALCSVLSPRGCKLTSVMRSQVHGLQAGRRARPPSRRRASTLPLHRGALHLGGRECRRPFSRRARLRASVLRTCRWDRERQCRAVVAGASTRASSPDRADPLRDESRCARSPSRSSSSPSCPIH